MTLASTWLKSLCLCAIVLVAAGSLLADRVAAAPQGSAGGGQQIDINKADEQQLAEIPGIGEAMAKRIIDFRQANGPFQRVEDLLKVKGIGEKSLEKLRPHVKIASPK
jgi:competence protein ComEA